MNTTGTEDLDYRAIYIACEVTNSCLIATTFFVLACTISYGWKTGKWKSSGRKSDVNGGVIFTACGVALALTLPRYVVNQLVFNVTHMERGGEWCEVILDVGNACYFTALYMIYVFLWLRQRALYGHPAMRKLTGKCVATFSWITLFVLSGAAVGVVLWFVIPEDYSYNSTGCVVKFNESDNVEGDFGYQLDYLALVGLLLAAQISLLGLFIYPMVRSNAVQSMRRSSRPSSRVNVFVYNANEDIVSTKRPSRLFAYIRQTKRSLSTSSNGRASTIQRTIRRSVLCAGVSMLSDIVAMVASSALLPRTLPRSVHNTVYDVSIMVSAICILASFRGYRKILTVWCRGAQTSKSDGTSNSADDSRRYSEKSQTVMS